jgi:hypothetical protein
MDEKKSPSPRISTNASVSHDRRLAEAIASEIPAATWQAMCDQSHVKRVTRRYGTDPVEVSRWMGWREGIEGCPEPGAVKNRRLSHAMEHDRAFAGTANALCASVLAEQDYGCAYAYYAMRPTPQNRKALGVERKKIIGLLDTQPGITAHETKEILRSVEAMIDRQLADRGMGSR